MSNEFYVYMLLDPRKFYLPFYIGKGKGYRYNDHLGKKLSSDTNQLKKHVIEKIRKTNQQPKIMIWKSELTEREAFALEKELVLRFGRRVDNTGILTNLTNGGEGLSGHQFSEEHRRKIGEANRNRIVTEETREKHRIIASQRPPISDETRQKLIQEAQRRKYSNIVFAEKQG